MVSTKVSLNFLGEESSETPQQATPGAVVSVLEASYRPPRISDAMRNANAINGAGTFRQWSGIHHTAVWLSAQ